MWIPRNDRNCVSCCVNYNQKHDNKDKFMYCTVNAFKCRPWLIRQTFVSPLLFFAQVMQFAIFVVCFK